MRREVFGELTRPADSLFEAGVSDDYVCQRGERRVRHDAAELQFPFTKRRVVLLDGVLDRVMPGIKGLDKHAARELAAAGAAGNLREQLEGALGSAKIRQA